MHSIRNPRVSQAHGNLEVAGMSLNNSFSNNQSNSLSFVDQLEKSLEIKEEFESIELRVKRLLADFDDFDSIDIYSGDLAKKIPPDMREKAFRKALKSSQSRLDALEKNINLICSGRLELLNDVENWFDKKVGNIDQDEHDWQRWELEAATSKAGVISQETMMHQLEEIKNAFSSKHTNAAKKILRLHKAMISDLKSTMQDVIEKTMEEVQSLRDQNLRDKESIEALLIEAKKFKIAKKEMKQKAAELAKTLIKTQKANVNLRSERSEAIAQKNIAEDTLKHIEETNKELRSEVLSLKSQVVSLENEQGRNNSRADIAEEALKSAEAMLTSQKQKIQAMQMIGSDNAKTMDLLKEKLKEKVKEIDSYRKAVQELHDQRVVVNRQHDIEVQSMKTEIDNVKSAYTNSIYELFRFQQAIWHGSLVGQFLSFARIQTPNVKSVAAGEVKFDYLDTLTRDMTKDIVLQVENQFKALRQSKSEADEANEDSKQSSSSSISNKSFGVSSAKLQEVKQKMISYKLRLAKEKTLLEETRKELREKSSVLESKTEEWNREKLALQDTLASRLSELEKQELDLVELRHSEEILEKKVRKLTEALQHGDGNVEAQLKLLLQQLAELEKKLKLANREKLQHAQEIARQKEEMAKLNNMLSNAQTEAVEKGLAEPREETLKKSKSTQKVDTRIIKYQSDIETLRAENSKLEMEISSHVCPVATKYITKAVRIEDHFDQRPEEEKFVEAPRIMCETGVQANLECKNNDEATPAYIVKHRPNMPQKQQVVLDPIIDIVDTRTIEVQTIITGGYRARKKNIEVTAPAKSPEVSVVSPPSVQEVEMKDFISRALSPIRFSKPPLPALEKPEYDTVTESYIHQIIENEIAPRNVEPINDARSATKIPQPTHTEKTVVTRVVYEKDDREIKRLLALNADHQNIIQQQEEHLLQLQKHVQRLQAIIDQHHQSQAQETMKFKISAQPDMDEIIMLLNQQSVALQRARAINSAMSKSIVQSQKEQDHNMKKYNKALLGLKSAYFRLLKEMSVLKNNVDNPTIIVKSLSTSGKAKQTKQKYGTTNSFHTFENDEKEKLTERKLSIKMKEANKFLEASSALHRTLTPTLIPEEEFVYNPEEGWTKVQAPENYFKAVNIQNLHPPNITPFQKGAIQVLEGSKLLSMKNSQENTQDPLTEYRINCGPIETPSKPTAKKTKAKGHKTESKLSFKQSVRKQDNLKSKNFLKASSCTSGGEIERPEDILPNPNKPLRQLPCRPPKRYSRRQIYSGRIANIADINCQKEHNLELLLRKHLEKKADFGDNNINNWWELYLNQAAHENE